MEFIINNGKLTEKEELKSYIVREMKIVYGNRKFKTKGRLSDPKLVYKFVKNILVNETQEVFCVICVDNKNNPIGFKEITRGTVNEAIVTPAEVFKFALLCNAVSIILIHNHPSGECEPSKEDGKLTERMAESGKLLGIMVLDHIIVGENKYYSFKEGESDKT